MKYHYNYGFFQQWLDANTHIPKGVIQEAFATSSNNRIKAWARGEGAMPVLSLLRFCNSFQVPLSSFFRNEDCDKDNDHAPIPAESGDMIYPHGGYAQSASERKHGERKAVDPTIVNVTPSVIPESDVQNSQAYTDKGSADATECKHAARNDNGKIIVGNISDANMAAIIKLQNEHVAIVNRLLDEISRLQDELHKRDEELNKAHGYQLGHEHDSYNMAPE